MVGYLGMMGYWGTRAFGVAVALAALGCGVPAHDPEGDEGEALATVSQALNSTLPEVPAIARDVAMIIGNQYTRPMVPPFRTSSDGRVAVNLKMLQDRPGFFLFTPEKLTAPIALNAPGAAMLASTTPASFGITHSNLHRHDNALGMGALDNRTICDPSASGTPNPTACGGSDCYSLTLVAGYTFTGTDGKKYVELWGTPLSVRVDNPKTANATLGSVTAGTPVKGPTWRATAFLEPMITDDGHLLVMRIADAPITWPSASGQVTGSYNIVYSPGSTSAAPCDVTQWGQLYPISHAPYDPEMRARYGFAQFPFRDPEGAVIPDGVEFKASYPWVDRAGKNLFFTTVSSMFFYATSSQPVTVRTRYPATCVPGTVCQSPTTSSTIGTEEEASHTRGVSVAGLWTRGKMVLLDNLLNNIDYGLRTADNEQRMVSLYEPNTGPLGTESGDVRMGAGRWNSANGWPAGSPTNTTFIDSLENLHNHVSHVRPLAFRDVVWTVNTGRGSDEVPFDDYLDPDALIISEMSGSQSFDGGPINKELYYHDGFVRNSALVGSGFADSEQIRVQNAATTLPERWVIPAYGSVTGGARLEPAALGGIHGKGLWLDGSDDAIEYSIASQPQNLDAVPYYASIFIDSRFANDNTRRRLITFPDGTHIALVGRRAVAYVNPSGATVRSVPLPSTQPLAFKGWAHLGFVVDNGGRRVEFYLDGFLANTWTSATTSLFRLSPGTLRVGATPSVAGFRGWIDEFKVVLRRPDPETLCNHARGTLLGLPATYSGNWDAVAARYPSASHTAITTALMLRSQPTFPEYVCFHDYVNDLGAHLDNLPAGTTSVRHAILFPEGPLAVDLPRPDSSQNGFCSSCHVDGQPDSLSPAALLPIAAPMQDDPRRQPSQPPPLVFGNVPAGYVPTTGLPSSPAQAPATGTSLDRWVFP